MKTFHLRRLLRVARREYLERVRSKAFMVATVLGPVILGGMMLIPALAARKATGPLRVAVLDADGQLRQPVEHALAAVTEGGSPRFVLRPAPGGPFAAAQHQLRQQVLKGELDGYLLLPRGALDSAQAEFNGRSVSAVMEMRLLEKALTDAFNRLRLSREGLDPAHIGTLMRDVDVKTMRLSDQGAREDHGAGFLFSTVLLLAIYTSVFMWGQALMTSVIEEKTNRVVEVMVSSVSPDTLLAGKMLGVGAAGLTQLTVWAATVGLIGLYVGGTAAGGGRAGVPEVGGWVLVAFVGFFLMGFFLYGSFYAAVGAAVNSMQEAQNLILPLLLPVIMAMMFFPVVLRSPDSTLSVVLSLIPLMAPLIMFLRISVQTPPLWQVALSIALTLLAIWGVIWTAARIYRVGILMYGKRPTFPEIMRWVRQS